ncbi:MAG: energy transducer TonB [Flavobacteriaceae bacterium]|jgi:hypothetical protein|nr:energy transducer TonB [Flavobacteriaceae bacterium]
MKIKTITMIFVLICVLFSVETASAQMQIPKDTSGKIYQKEEVDKYIEYKGGMPSFNRLFIGRFNANIPNKSLFKIVMQFTVETNGEMTDLKVIDIETIGIEEALIEEYIKKAIYSFGTLKDWIPAVKDGKLVRCVVKLPITMNSNR